MMMIIIIIIVVVIMIMLSGMSLQGTQLVSAQAIPRSTHLDLRSRLLSGETFVPEFVFF